MAPDDRIVVSAEAVHRLVARQFPAWAHLPVREVPRPGWDNRTFRLGDDLKVRLPSAARYVAQVAKEHRWLPVLAPRLPLPVSRPRAIGAPDEGVPWPWSVQDWLPGTPVSADRLDDPVRFAEDLAGFLRALRAVPPDGPPAGDHSFHRGGSLAVYDEEARRSISVAAARGAVDGPAALRVWEKALGADWSGPPVWVHGDIATGNLLLRRGRLAAVIDWGSSAVGDPACDLVIAWTFLEGRARDAFRAGVDADEGTWARARGWALWKTCLTLAEGGAPPPPGETPPGKVLAAVIAGTWEAPS